MLPVVANEGQRIDIPDGCILENRLVSGNLNLIVRVWVLYIKEPSLMPSYRSFNLAVDFLFFYGLLRHRVVVSLGHAGR